MKDQRLRDSLEILYGIREELSSKVEDSVREQLDISISKLENAAGDKADVDIKDLLDTIGFALRLVASIKAIAEIIK
jgi:hypothetical protein